MKPVLLILLSLTTWLPQVAYLMWLGAALLLATLALAALGLDHAAFGTSIYAFSLLLALPYLLAWHPFRTMLASRRLAQLPGFRLRLGLAMLLLTLLLSLYLPFASLLLLPGAVEPRMAVAIFLGASLFTIVLQAISASPYALVVLSICPVIAVYTTAKLWPVLQMALTRDASLYCILLACTLGWSLALHEISSRRDFRPPRKAPLQMPGYVWEGRTEWLGIEAGNFRGRIDSSAGTLLLGFPDGLATRVVTLFNILVVSPAVIGLIIYFLGLAPRALDEPGHLAGMLLHFSLGTGIFSAFGNGELAARARLLWLREGGDRAAQWRRLEQRLALNFVVFASLVILITGVALMLPAITLDPLAYCLIALCGNLLTNYFSLAARLSRWSLLIQMLSAFVTGTALMIGFLITALLLPVLVAILLGLTLLFRQQAWLRFADVDWHLVQPAAVAARVAAA